MFEFIIKKEDLLTPLLTVAGAIDKKQSLTILSNFYLKLEKGFLNITATDLEIEISALVACDADQNFGSITVPAKKFIDIIRSLDDQTSPKLLVNNSILTIKQGRSFFKLATLPAEDYPLNKEECNDIEISIPRLVLLKLLQSTQFAMAQQDVRVFLNGLFLDFESNLISAVAADGHRMAISRYKCDNLSEKKLLIPKKSIQELIRILTSIDDNNILLLAGKAHIKIISRQFVFLSKLIEARFPAYAKAIPRHQDKHIIIECSILKRSLSRIVILAHEKSKAVLLHVQAGLITLIANNNEQEEAVESLTAETEGEELKIGFNATYLLDILSYLGEGRIRLSLSNTESSILVELLDDEHYYYIIMPMKI